MWTDEGWVDERPRRPTDVPELPVDTTDGLDTDGDSRPDTVIRSEGADLAVYTDLDGDGLADQVLLIGADGAATVTDVTSTESSVDPGPERLSGFTGEGSAPIT